MDCRGSRRGLNWGCERLKPPQMTEMGAVSSHNYEATRATNPSQQKGERSRAIVVSDVKDSDHRISPKCSVGLLP